MSSPFEEPIDRMATLAPLVPKIREEVNKWRANGYPGASETTQFKIDYGNEWKQKAKDNPEKVAEYLYTYQSEERFGADNRLLIVYLDDDVSIARVEAALNDVNFSSPLKISFTFRHKKTGAKKYVANCFIILLSNS